MNSILLNAQSAITYIRNEYPEIPKLEQLLKPLDTLLDRYENISGESIDIDELTECMDKFEESIRN